MNLIISFSLLISGFMARVAPQAEAPAASQGSIQVNISGLSNSKGQVGILLFRQKEGFPSNREKAFQEVLLPISGNKATHTFTNLPYGRYAVSVMHDENKNNKLDTNMLGIPKEGYGVSNNATGKFGPPKFEDAVFSLNQGNHTIDIKVNY